MTDERQQITENRQQTTDNRNTIRNLLWFIFFTLVSVVVVQHVALLGLALAAIGGVVLGVLVTRESKA